MSGTTYEECAHEYAAMLADEERADFSPSRDMILPVLLSFLGDVDGIDVLDAGCGEGRVSRILSGRGARVLGVDISPTLIDMARRRAEGPRVGYGVGHGVEYRVADLTKPLDDAKGRFGLVVSHLVIDDVADYDAFVRTLSLACASPGRIILSKNNPYSAVVRGKVARYFDSGASAPYHGMSSKGVRVHYHHRTLEDHVSAFRHQGFCLSGLSDVAPPADDTVSDPRSGDFVRRYRQFPYFMVLEFTRGTRAGDA